MKLIQHHQWSETEPITRHARGHSMGLLVGTAASPLEALEAVRHLQTTDLQRGLVDIVWSWIVGHDGELIEGRGWGNDHEAAPRGSDAYHENDRTHSVCVLVPRPNAEPTVAQWRTVRFLVDEHLRIYRDCYQHSANGALPSRFANWLATGCPPPPPDATDPEYAPEVDPLMALLPVLDSTSEGLPVRRLQSLLNVMCNAGLRIDGKMTAPTQAALQRFQETRDIAFDDPETVTVDAATWSALLAEEM